jgi:hypothetical protein
VVWSSGNSADRSILFGGGAIEANPGSNLEVLNCSFVGNQVNNSGGAAASGGAIDTSANVRVTISGSQFISNSSIASGVGASAYAGAVDDYQTMTIDNSLFTGNRAVGGPMADGVSTFGQGIGGAIRGAGSGVMLTLSNSIVVDNEAIGGSGGTTLPYPRTDAAFGGGIAFGGQTLNITGCTITGNQALGGAVASGSGAPAFGGGIFNNIPATLNIMNSTVSANHCQGGAGTSGYAGGLASGGGIANARGGIALLTNCTLSLNVSQGGAGGAGANGGIALGGGISNAVYAFAYGITDASSLIVSNCQVVGNTAQGGTAGSSAQGGDGLGGGLFVGSSAAVLEAVLVSDNQAQGGVDSEENTSGNGLGGGVYVDPSATVSANAQTIMVGNHASKDNNDVFGTINIVP